MSATLVETLPAPAGASVWTRYPSLYEINTWVWLSALSQKYGKSVDLSSVPSAEWDAIAAYGFDGVWFMGVWERSPAGIRIANQNKGLLDDFRRALPDFRLEDNVGSPYCVRSYVVDKHLGGPEGLAIARRELAKRGMKLVLDFVPNHVAPDHPWAAQHPEYFVRGNAGDIKNDPSSFVEVGGKIFARGRDPYFPAWPDVLQLNAFDPGLRQAVIETLSDIARQCDGIRCDMAMLLLNPIFERTWGGRAGPRPDTEYWHDVIPAIKDKHPGFLFIAEAYWDLEWELMQQGFDFCYDKRLYDRLEHNQTESARLHLCADLAYQGKLLRFIENHDEPRAAATFAPEKQRAVALLTATLPGIRLFHEGQFEGRKVRVPVFLGRRPDEPVDRGLSEFYTELLEAVNRPIFREGQWSLCERTGWADNASYQNVVAWSWQKDDEQYLIVVNLSDHPSQAKIQVRWADAGGRKWRLTDALSGANYELDGAELLSPGLYVELGPWNYHFFQCAHEQGLKSRIAHMGTNEQRRLDDAREKQIPWKKWGPYLSERQWGTVREDYSQDGHAWNYFTHDHARSRAYRWGEDGLGGISDDHQILCFALALWNGRDPLLKERLFGLSNGEGNHGEDVKEYYFYLDNTPTHSYMKYLYKYPQAAFPYTDLIENNRRRGRHDLEYELLDTGVFDSNRYFDVFVEYAKGGPEDLLIKISAVNRGSEPAALQVLPTLWYRNTWSWRGGGSKPELVRVEDWDGASVVRAQHTDPFFRESLPGQYYLYCESRPPVLFTENETNHERVFGGQNASPYVKDGINNFIVNGQQAATNPANIGTKASAVYPMTIGPGQTVTVKLRFTTSEPKSWFQPFADFDQIFADRMREADEFHDSITPPKVKKDPDRANIMRQARAGMLWGKQYFNYDLATWLEERDIGPSSPSWMRARVRNAEWFHMQNHDIISMPDKWEYPWYAAWDLAFHMLPFVTLDPDFAKTQLDLMLRNDYLHPNGQVPAYEWNFGDVNPPVHAYATIQIYLQDKAKNNGKGDLDFLRYAFSKLLLNFTWWLNRKDRSGNNVFEGGFLGLDNIGVFDRSAPLPTGGHLEQADGTAWMAHYSQQMLRIAVELANHDPHYEEFVTKFFEHTLRIAAAMDRIGERHDDMWDEEDGFFYDVLQLPDGNATRLKVRSMVGLLPITAVTVFEKNDLENLPQFLRSAREFLRRHPELTANLHMPSTPGVAGRRMISTVNESKLRRILARMLDENEFFSPYGIRALSRYHLEHPYVYHHNGQEFRVSYVPGDSDSGMFGGNSNWRGPVWMPVNMMLVGALIRMAAYYGDSFKVECPTGSGNQMTLLEVAHELMERLIRIFQRDSQGRRPVYGGAEKFQRDPHWRDHILFYEYFHGDNGAGIGAGHQTGWTGCIARFIALHASLTKEMLYSPGVQEEAHRSLTGMPTRKEAA